MLGPPVCPGFAVTALMNLLVRFGVTTLFTVLPSHSAQVVGIVLTLPDHMIKNDKVAKAILEKVYPGREIVLVDATEIFARGGGIHCITQQQPA